MIPRRDSLPSLGPTPSRDLPALRRVLLFTLPYRIRMAGAVLDEATSALDAESEHAVQRALAALSAGPTTIVIAHRLATVLRADRIIVLEEGRVAAAGSHAELLRQGGLYTRLAALRFDLAGASISGGKYDLQTLNRR